MRVQTHSTLRPGSYRLTLTARQGVSGRVGGRLRTATAILTVESAGPDFVTMQAGRATTRRDGLRAVPITVHVVDQSDALVRAGTPLTLDSTDGVLQPAQIRTRGGIAHATLVYVPGTRPVVTANALVTSGRLYLGLVPAGASTTRYFAASSGRDAVSASRGRQAAPAIGEDIVVRDPLSIPTQVRLRLYVADPATGSIAAQLVSLQVSAHSTDVTRLDALVAGHTLVGVDVQSDVPVISRRVARQAAAHGQTRSLGATAGVATPRPAYNLTLVGVVHGAHTAIDLYNPTQQIEVVRVAVGRHVIRHVLLPRGSLRVELATVIAATPPRGHGKVGVTVRASAPIVAEIDPAPSPALPFATTKGQACVGVNGYVRSCAAHYLPPKGS